MSPTSGVIGEAWGIYKTHWRHLLTLSFVTYLVVAILAALLAAILTWVGVLIGLILTFVAAFWLQAALVKAVEDVRDGRADMSLQETFAAAKPHLGSVIVAGILAGIAIAIGFVLLIAPGLDLLTIWAVTVIVLEGKSAGESFSRSRELVRGYGLGALGVIVLTALLLIGVEIVLGLILSPLADWLQGFLSNIVTGTLTAPVFAIVLTLLVSRLKAASSRRRSTSHSRRRRSPRRPSPRPSSRFPSPHDLSWILAPHVRGPWGGEQRRHCGYMPADSDVGRVSSASATGSPWTREFFARAWFRGDERPPCRPKRG